MRRIVLFLLSALLVILVLLVVRNWGLFLFPFLIAYILQFALRPLVYKLEQAGLSHSFSSATVFFGFFSLIALALRIIIPAIYREIATVQMNLPIYQSILMNKVKTLEAYLESQFSWLFEIIGTGYDIDTLFASFISSTVMSFISSIPSVLMNILPLFLFFLIIPFATFFFLYDEHVIKKALVHMVPNRYFESILSLIHKLNTQFGLILRGMMISVFIMSTVISTGLWLIGMEYPIMIGVFSGFLNLIPYAGPIGGVLSASFVAVITGSPGSMFLLVILVFICANVIDNILIQPLVLARAANLHPVAVLILVIIGSRIGGLPGMFIAVPVASLLRIVYKTVSAELSRSRKPVIAIRPEILG